MTTFKVYITKLQHNYPTFWKQKTRNGTPTPHAMNTMQIMTIKKPTKQNTANCQTSKQIKPCPTCFSKHVVFLCSKVAQKRFLFVVRIGVEKTMPPKMVMKVMKTMTKQKKKNQSKGSKGLEKPKSKGLEKPSSKPKKRLTKSNLEKLGKVSLKEKMKVATEDAASPEDAAIVLYNSMDKNEKAKAWSKHQTALKKASDAEKEEYENLSKKDKGIQAAAHLLEKEGKQYMATLKKVSTQDTFKQTDQWVSEKQMLQKWTAEELDAHIASGRIRWRECPGTWGVYEYKDTQDWSREVAQTRSKEFQQGNEWDPADEDLEKFLELYSKDWTSLTLDVSGKGSGKSSPGLGKGQGGKGKGQSLGKGKHRREQKEKPGIEQETDLEKVLKACKKARNMVSSCKADLELALEKVNCPSLAKAMP